MMKACKCGSYAINHNCHGRDGSDDDLCDVCYWRKRAEQPAPMIRGDIRDGLVDDEPAQQHIEHCLWARNGNQPCPHVQPAQQEPVAKMGMYEHKCPNVTGHRGPSFVCQKAGHGVGQNSYCKNCTCPEALNTSPQSAQQELVAHCEAGPEHCPVCLAETRSLALAAAVGYIQRNTPKLVSEEICRALKKASPPAQRTWVGLTDEEIAQGNKESWVTEQAWQSAVWWAEAKLREKNQ